MTIHLAMLRGINVSGHKPVRMERLRRAFEALGFDGVKTYIQSGNVIFKAASHGEAALAGKIRGKILEEFGFEVPVALRTAGELEKAIRKNPLLAAAGAESTKLYVTFLVEPVSRAAVEKLMPLLAAGEECAIRGREVYYYCPKNYGRAKFSNAAIEDRLGIQATTRNWRTVGILREMMAS